MDYLKDGALADGDGVAGDHAHVALRLAAVAGEGRLVGLVPARAARAHRQRLLHLFSTAYGDSILLMFC